MALCVCILCRRTIDCSGDMLCELCEMNVLAMGMTPREALEKITNSATEESTKYATK